MSAVRYEVYEDNGGGLTLIVICRCGHVVHARSGYNKPELLMMDLRELDRMTDIRDIWFWGGCESDPESLRKTFKADPQNNKLICEGDSNHRRTYPERMGAAGKSAFEEE